MLASIKQLEKFSFQRFISQHNLKGLYKNNFSKSLCKIPEYCGSCQLSYMPYNLQLSIKKRYVINLLELTGKIPQNVLTNIDIIGSIPNTFYRGRMDYAVNYKGFLGLKRKGNWAYIIPRHTCILPLPVIKQTFNLLNKIVPKYINGYDRIAKKGFVSFIVIRGSLLKEVSINFVIRKDIIDAFSKKEFKENILKIILIIKEFSSIVKSKKLSIKLKGVTVAQTTSNREESNGEVFLTLKIKKGRFYFNILNENFNKKYNLNKFLQSKNYLYNEKLNVITINEVINGITFKIPAFSFFQPNHYTSGILQKIVANSVFNVINDLKLQEDIKEFKPVVVDLFGGQGFLGGYVHFVIKQDLKLPVSTKIIELDKNAIDLGKRVWRKFLGKKLFSGLSFEIADAYNFNLPKATILILDPPRRGLTKRLIKQILANPKIKYMIYVSCNIKQFAIEFATHLSKHFEVISVKVLDQFPHTYHLESIIVLKRSM